VRRLFADQTRDRKKAKPAAVNSPGGQQTQIRSWPLTPDLLDQQNGGFVALKRKRRARKVRRGVSASSRQRLVHDPEKCEAVFRIMHNQESKAR